jgi:hypothetical protein
MFDSGRHYNPMRRARQPVFQTLRENAWKDAARAAFPGEGDISTLG